MPAGEIAIPIGYGIVLDADRPPYGCDIDDKIAVHHHPMRGQIAAAARSLYYTRRLAEDLAHLEDAPETVRHWSEDVAKYANDLEFFVRQLGLGLKMPVMVEEPYLPLDMRSMPLPLMLLRPPLSDSSLAQRPRADGKSTQKEALSRAHRDFL
mmetsp:Transcript_74902/g.118093  ORF Transcript_74902/g.118093 Transcript_74902/m.118093 type:complete len:153 (+) Transcript_74902:57-515(+)